MSGNTRNWFHLIFILLFITIECLEYPDVSQNQHFCYQDFMQEKLHSCQCEKYEENYLKGKNSYLKFWVGGRLANKMFAYALLLGLKRSYGYRVFLEGRHLEHLSYYFQNIEDVESLDLLCDEETSFPWQNSTGSLQSLGHDDVRYGHYIDYAKSLRMLANNVNTIMKWEKFVAEYEPDIRHAFKFKDKFIIGADRRIRKFTDKFKEKLGKKWSKVKNIIYVGVHIRLRDAGRDMIQSYGLEPITFSSYINAMSSVADKFEKKGTKVLFLLVSDDPITVFRMLLPRLRRSFNVYMGGTGHVNNRISVGLDMALLSRCNYTILSYGTYSFWAGFLSNRPKILPIHYLSMKGVKWNGDRPATYQHPFLLPDIGITASKDNKPNKKLRQ